MPEREPECRVVIFSLKAHHEIDGGGPLISGMTNCWPTVLIYIYF